MKIFPTSYFDALVDKTSTPNSASGMPKSSIRLNPILIAAFLLAAIVFPMLIAKTGLVSGLLILIVAIGLPIIYAVVVYPEAGIVILLIAAYFVMWVIRIGVNFPLGTLMDALQVLLYLGFFIKQKTRPDWSILNSPISKIILIWVFYNLMEVFNSEINCWLFTIRTVAVVTLSYFVFVYQIRTIAFVRILIKVWLALAFFAAVYGFKQEYFGFFGFELRELSDPDTMLLLFINGVWRKFSIFSDPVAFAYNMVISSLLCISLMTYTQKTWKKIVMLLLTLFFLMNMLFSGTRGAYVLIPASLVLIAILNYSRKVLIISIIAGMMIGALIVVPTSNQTITRFQSAFKPSDDASYNVRKNNQKRIKPFILSHPFGGGLGATGVWGKRFAPNSYLANFPPDSGYVRVAVELGWVGLILICTLMFVILKTGVKNYFLIRNPELKAYCLAATTGIFALNIGNFPQEAIVQFPSNIMFVLLSTLIPITLKLDQLQFNNKNNIAGTNN